MLDNILAKQAIEPDDRPYGGLLTGCEEYGSAATDYVAGIIRDIGTIERSGTLEASPPIRRLLLRQMDAALTGRVAAMAIENVIGQDPHLEAEYTELRARLDEHLA